jgi:hypothetical protein
MAFFPKLQLFVWIACDASFAQACRKHKLPCLRRKTDFTLRLESICVVGGRSPCC